MKVYFVVGKLEHGVSLGVLFHVFPKKEVNREVTCHLWCWILEFRWIVTKGWCSAQFGKFGRNWLDWQLSSEHVILGHSTKCLRSGSLRPCVIWVAVGSLVPYSSDMHWVLQTLFIQTDSIRVPLVNWHQSCVLMPGICFGFMLLRTFCQLFLKQKLGRGTLTKFQLLGAISNAYKYQEKTIYLPMPNK